MTSRRDFLTKSVTAAGHMFCGCDLTGSAQAVTGHPVWQAGRRIWPILFTAWQGFAGGCSIKH